MGKNQARDFRGRGGGSAGRTKTVAGSIGSVEIVDGQKYHGFDFLHEDLGDAVAFLDEVLAVGVIEQEDFDFAAVLGIDHPGAAIDAVFDGHATARPDEADVVLRQCEADSSGHQHFAAGGDDGIGGGTQIRSRVTGVGVGGGEPSCHTAHGFRFVEYIHFNMKKPRRKMQENVGVWVGQTL